jgi:ribosomal protein L40E
MARGVQVAGVPFEQCPKCECRNDAGALFCQECGAHLQRISHKDIERMPHQALCNRCDYYNPIEADVCGRCGHQLRADRGVMVKGQDGRATLVRENPLPPVVKGLAWVMFVVVLALLAFMTFAIAEVGGIGGVLEGFRGRMALCCWCALFLFLGGEWRTSGILYRTKTALVLFLLFMAAQLNAGPPPLALWGVGEGQVQLAALLGVLIFCELYIVHGGTPPGMLSTAMAFLGLYVSISPILTLLAGGGLVESVSGNQNLVRDVPAALGSSFLGFHVFLPFCFLAMVFSTVRSYEQSMLKVSGTQTLMRFLRRRKEEARGHLLNLFIVGTTLYVGFETMDQCGVRNALTMAGALWGRYF